MLDPLATQSGTAVTLQSLIDARHNVIRQRAGSPPGHSNVPGLRNGSRRGQGLEFIDLRQYHETDDIRHIDWNVTARSNEAYTRLYREEREHIATVVVDLRSTMFTGSDILRAASAAQLAASTLWQAADTGDRCAAIVVSAKGIQASRPVAGTKGVLQALELVANAYHDADAALNNHSQTFKQHGQEPLLSDLLTYLNKRATSSGSYYFFSGFDTDNDKYWRKLLPVSARSVKLNALLVLDKLEQQSLPAGHYNYKTISDRQHAVINSQNQYALSEALKQNLQRREQQFTDLNIPTLTVLSTISPPELLAKILRRKWL